MRDCDSHNKMITTNKTSKYARLDTRILSIDDFYIEWRQYVRGDGALVHLGTFVFQKRSSKGWSIILKDRIFKLNKSTNLMR